MGYFGGVWKGLKFNTGSAVLQLGSGFNYRFNQKNSDLVYKNPRYKSVAVHVARQLVMATIEREAKELLPKYRRHIENVMRKDVLKQQAAHRVAIIKNSEIQSQNWGRIMVKGSGRDTYVYAKDRFGNRVPEALMLYYNDTEEHVVEDIVYGKSNDIASKNSFKTNTIWHTDLSPKVSVSSSKNIVMTKVQGRDYTRKELVSGGDMSFSVQGLIVSDLEGVYPDTAVKKFVKLMQHNGILNVNFMTFGVLGVTRVIITDWNLGTVDYKNEQPYSFNCVAVEPDDEITISKDTIGVIDRELKLSPMNKWYNMILNNKLAEITANTLIDNTANLVSKGVSVGLDKLVPNI